MADPAAGVSDCIQELTPGRRLWLEELDRDATPLLDHLSQRHSHRLGVYFEQLWHFYLKANPDTDLVAHNLPVHREGRTLGEFDCLYFCRRRMSHVHLELAVKYYLAAPADPGDERSARRWWGPNTRDRLDVKLAQLLEKQIRLSESVAAGPLLAELGIEKPLREIAFKGYLFQPLTGAPPPIGYNNENRMNDWLRPTDLAGYCAAKTLDHFTRLPKMCWLSPACQNFPGDVLDREELATTVERHFETEHYPLLVSSLDGLGEEVGRFFVVPEHWPEEP